MATPQKRVVIIGGGYAGSSAAAILDKKFDVTLVDRSEVKYHSIAAPRALAETTGTWIDRILVPRKLKRGKLVVGVVELVDARNNKVVLSSGETLPYDYVLIATGSTTSWPTKPDGAELLTRESITQHLRGLQDQIKSSKSIAIIGGGPTGTELAGELRHWNPNTSVTLFHSGQQLVADNFKPKFYKKLTESLNDAGVKVVLGHTAVVSGGTSDPATGSLPRPVRGPCTVTAGSTTVEADLVFNCTGIRLNNQLIKASFPTLLDEKGQLKVNEFLQVEGFTNVFAAGDITSRDPRKLAYIADLQAKLAVKNIIALTGGKKLSSKDGSFPLDKPVGFIVLSPQRGVGQLPFFGGLVLGDGACKAIKGKSLFCEDQFKLFGLRAPVGRA